jgi:hypothetical protein
MLDAGLLPHPRRDHRHNLHVPVQRSTLDVGRSMFDVFLILVSILIPILVVLIATLEPAVLHRLFSCALDGPATER